MPFNPKLIRPLVIKRILILCFLWLWFIQNTKAQDLDELQSLNRKIKWGIMFGLNYAQVDLSKSKLPTLEFKNDNKMGLSLGIRAKIPLSDKFSLQTGLNFHIFLFELKQTSFGIDSLTGFIIKQPWVESWEIPVILSYKLPFKNNLLKNIYVAGGMGLALDHYKRISETTIVLDPRNNNNLYNYYNGRSETGNVFAPNLIAGIGTDVNILASRKLQLNFWYTQGLKQQDQLITNTILDGRVDYPWEINALVSSFRMEVVYFP